MFKINQYCIIISVIFNILDKGAKMKVLVIIPAYNEEENILRVVRQLEAANTGCDYVVINDCSKDSTPKILEKIK